MTLQNGHKTDRDKGVKLKLFKKKVIHEFKVLLELQYRIPPHLTSAFHQKAHLLSAAVLSSLIQGITFPYKS